MQIRQPSQPDQSSSGKSGTPSQPDQSCSGKSGTPSQPDQSCSGKSGKPLSLINPAQANQAIRQKKEIRKKSNHHYHFHYHHYYYSSIKCSCCNHHSCYWQRRGDDRQRCRFGGYDRQRRNKRRVQPGTRQPQLWAPAWLLTYWSARL